MEGRGEMRGEEKRRRGLGTEAKRVRNGTEGESEGEVEGMKRSKGGVEG